MQRVEIRVAECLDEEWADWLDGLNIVHTSAGETLIIGTVVDQAALYGLIAKLRDLGLKLLSINYDGVSSLELASEE